MRETELLIPAGNLDVLEAAVIFGTDVVYIEGEAFGLRARAYNLSRNDMKEGIVFAHARGVKAYATADTLAHNGDLPGVETYFEKLKEMSPGALVILDPGVFAVVKKALPGMEIRISAQTNNINYGTYLFQHKLGARRVATARELPLDEIRKIREHIPKDMKIESFIHGTIRISYSGCYLPNNFFVGEDANQDACTHPCRWKYSIMEETRLGEYVSVYESERGTYTFSSKDLCMIDHIPEMVSAGIDSFKTEGRMKTTLYVAVVARTYRKAIGDYRKDPQLYRDHMKWYRREIEKRTYKEFITGSYFGRPTEDAQIYDNNTHVKNYIYLGTVLEVDGRGWCLIQQENEFCVGDTIEMMKPGDRNLELTVAGMEDKEGDAQDSTPYSKQVLWINLGMDADLEVYDILCKKEESA